MFEIGNSLREARERQGLDLRQVEADTKVRVKFLRALEEERFDVLPADSYARGFLDVYATRLGLDSQLYVDEFDSRFADGRDDRADVRRVRSARRLRFEASAVVLGLFGILLLTVLVIAAWQFSGGSPESEPAPKAAVEPTPVAPPSASTPPPATAPVETEPVASAEPQPAPAAPAQDAVVNVRATKRGVRVTVRRNGPTGQVLFAGRLTRDEARVFEAPRIHVAFREPASVEVRVNGEVLPSVPRRLVATADGWRRG